VFGTGPRRPLDREQRARFRYLGSLDDLFKIVR
jgi:hypothetical protein